MYRTATSNRVIGLAVTTAMAGALLSGCTTNAAPPAAQSASRAEQALDAGKAGKAIRNAEAAVLAEPRNAAYRAMLGSAYLDAGRFSSAATSFDDAMQLGDHSARTALSLALALAGEGKHPQAAALLNEWEGEIATADLGLALALAGQPERGVHLMGNAIRNGDNTPKMRQNLAYAYALAGRWREARLMAAQDVPADQLGARIEEWAMMAQPEAWQQRIAALLDVPAAASDAGQPVQLALSNNPSIDQLAEQATALAAADVPAPAPAAFAEAPSAELPPLAVANAVPERAMPVTPANFEAAFAPPAPTAPTAPVAGPVSEQALSFVQTPVVQAVPVSPASRNAGPVTQDAQRFVQAAAAPARPTAPARTAARASQRGESGHLIQLGSFTSEQGARRAWKIYTQRYPELAGHQMVLSEAVVRGKHYWRVSAGGFGKSSSTSMCGKVKASGEGCFAYAEGRPMPGAIDTGVRMARR